MNGPEIEFRIIISDFDTMSTLMMMTTTTTDKCVLQAQVHLSDCQLEEAKVLIAVQLLRKEDRNNAGSEHTREINDHKMAWPPYARRQPESHLSDHLILEVNLQCECWFNSLVSWLVCLFPYHKQISQIDMMAELNCVRDRLPYGPISGLNWTIRQPN